MKYWTICYPGDVGQHVQETFSEYQILQSYFDYWYQQMRKVERYDEVTIENCIQDWVVGHWAWESDAQGNKNTPITEQDFDDWTWESDGR
jgi:hypothetical protein